MTEQRKDVQREVNLAVADFLVSQGWTLERDNEAGGGLVLLKDGSYVVGGFHAYDDKAPVPTPVQKAEGKEPLPEEVVTRWRSENVDDDANHNYDGPLLSDGEGNPPKCLVCGDDPAGLLHAFDPQFPEGYHDEAIYEVQSQIDEEDASEPGAIDYVFPERSLTWLRAGYPEEGGEEHEHHHGGAFHRHVGGDVAHGHRHIRQDETTLLDTFYLLDEVDPPSPEVVAAIREAQGQEISFDLQGFDKVPGDLLGPGPHVTPDENDEHFADSDANHGEPEPEPKPVPKRRGPRKKA